ncbi:MAG TPA: xanthine dehydrogenase family protein molybdopterin-binding subunit [Burkholderiales bacterium]|jgi:carbon-monoxide dehydrogenase large subunit|nr:xanthine dehydrogenase family protein molybdopterin-binding subunit [Burkholderiales bacterium]
MALTLPASSPSSRFGTSQAFNRFEDSRLILGQGRFTDNLKSDQALHVIFARSPQAHARIVSIDSSAAAAMPGVVKILSGADLEAAGLGTLPTVPIFKRADGQPMSMPPRRALAHEFVRFVGEAVVAVIAETRAQAEDAAEAVQIEYEELPAVTDPRDALAAGAPEIWAGAPGNLAAVNKHGNAEAVAAAFAAAAHIVKLDLVNQRVSPNAMEPRAVMASFDEASGRITLQVGSQTPTGTRDTLGDAVLKIGKDRVRVLVGDIGGGFGMKTSVYPEDAFVAYAAREMKRPVRWRGERAEEFLTGTHGRDLISEAELALDESGKALALRVKSLANIGAYASQAGPIIQLLIGPWVSTSVYDIPLIDFDLRAVITNTAPTGAYRGAGRPEAIYIIERLMNAAAGEMKIDPAEIRRRNLIRPEQMPYKNPMGQVYDSGKFEQMLDEGLELADWKGYAARKAQSQKNGKLRGRAVSTFLEWTSGNVFEEKVFCTVNDNGRITVSSGTQSMGQGIETSFMQLVSKVFGIGADKIDVILGDTDVMTGGGSVGSRSLFVGGSALKVGAERTIDRAKELAAEEFEAAVGDVTYAAGKFSVAGTDISIGLFELAAKQADRRIHLESVSAVGAPSWPNGCHVAEVEIDPDTGVVEVVKYSSVNDVGNVVNHPIVHGQIQGGAVQGIGQALGEQVVYDRESGQMLTGSFMDYTAPHVGIVSDFVTAFDETVPCLTNPLGAKGIGELGTIGATPTVVNAVIDALSARGITHLDMPLTPSRVWEALKA